MQPIILVAETGSDITPELASQHNIQLIPMHVSFDTETFDDGSFPVQKICDYYHSTGKLPRTSGSSPEDFTQAFDRIHDQYPEAQILYLAYSAVTTCSYQSALIADGEVLIENRIFQSHTFPHFFAEVRRKRTEQQYQLS